MNDAIYELSRSRQLRGLLMFAGVIWLAWVVGNWILSGSLEYLLMGAMGVGMIAIILNILRDWRTGLLFFFLWLLFEDLARKYLGNGTALFFGKDVLVAVIYVAVFLAWRRGQVKLFRPPFLVPLALFFGLALVQVFNTWSPTILYGLLGMKLYFYYVPLMFVGYALLKTHKDLDRFLIFNIAVGFVIALIGIAQTIIGVTFMNPSNGAAELEFSEHYTRYSPITHQAVAIPSSVFVSTGRFSMYMTLLIILSLIGQAYMLLTGRKRAVYGFIGVGLGFLGAMQSGSRGSILYSVASILLISAGLLWGAPWNWGQGQRLVKAIRNSFLIGAIGLLVMVQLFPASIGADWAFYSETLSPNSSAFELQDRTVDYPLINLEKAFQHDRWIVGYGTGVGSLGMQYVDRLIGASEHDDIGVENGYGTLVVEMGVFGLVLWIVWTFALLFSAWRVVRRLRGTVYFPVGFGIFWYCFMLLVPFTYTSMVGYQNFVMNAYLWILVGVLFRLPDLAQMPWEAVEGQQVSKSATVPVFAGAR